MFWLSLLFFKQKTAYEMRISDWSSDVCSSDLIVGTIDARTIVDEVRVDPPAVQCVGDAPCLRNAQIGSFADHLRAQLLSVHTQAVIGGIAHISIIFGSRLHEGADPAKPEQVGRGFQYCRYELRWLQFVVRYVEQQLYFRAEGDALLTARKHAAASRNQPPVVVVPA